MAKTMSKSPGVCGLALEPGYPYGQQPLPEPAMLEVNWVWSRVWFLVI